MNIKLSHGLYMDCIIKEHKYENGRSALVIYQNDEVLCKATVNMPETIIPDGYVCIKDWSENEGVLNSLIIAGVIYPPEYSMPSGFVYVDVCKLKEQII